MISLDDIKNHLCSYDPYGLTGFPTLCPRDEYDGEAEDIYERLKQIDEPTVEDIEKIIRDVFEGAKIEISKIAIFCLARSIIDDDIHICPVCRENYFDERGSFDICPVCGWEDDPIQYEDHYYCGGANHLNVKICQMEHFLVHEDSTADECRRLARQYGEIIGIIYSSDPPDRENNESKFDDLNFNYARSLVKLFTDNFVTFNNANSNEDDVSSFIDDFMKQVYKKRK